MIWLLKPDCALPDPGPRELDTKKMSKNKYLQKTPGHILFLLELLKRQGIGSRNVTLIEGVKLLGGEVTTEDGAKEWLRERWREMSLQTREIETLKRIRLSRSIQGRMVARHWNHN